MHHQVRHGLLPTLAALAGLAHKLPEVHVVYDALVGDDLRYDLRQGSPLPSGASGALSPFLLSMSMGAQQDTAVRYQCEPVVPRRTFGGRPAAFKKRLGAAVRSGVGNYAVDKVMAAWVAACPFESMTLDNVRPSFGVRHYPNRGPDISAYFVLETPDPMWSHGAVQRALQAMGEDELWRQIEAFDKATFRVRGFGILAVDLAADGTFEVKLYKRSERVGPRQLARLFAALGADARGEELYRRFRRTFVPSYVRPLLGAIGWVFDRGGRPPACKIYLDTSMMYDDAEAIRRLRGWLDDVGFSSAREVFERVQEQVAPTELLVGVGNFIDLVSLDVGGQGRFKTTVLLRTGSGTAPARATGSVIAAHVEWRAALGSHVNTPPVLYVVATGARLQHWDEPVTAALILNRPLREWQERAGRLAGLEVRFVDSPAEVQPPCFVMDDDLFVTRHALQEFVRRAPSRGRSVQAAVPRHPLLDAVVQTQGAEALSDGWGYRLRYLQAPDESCERLLIPLPDLDGQRLKVPLAIRPDGTAPLYRTAFGVVHLRSALHVYQANMHAVASSALERTRRFAFQRRAEPPESPRNNRIGSHCIIHPTALVENCEVGEGATIGAYAVCRESVIGAGAHIWDAAIIQQSVVGTHAMVGHQYRVVLSVMYPHAFATSGALQFSIMGHRSAVFAAWITDVRMDGKTVRVPLDGTVVDTGMDYFGCIVGHDAKVTAGVITAPGRVVPNGTVVHADPALVYQGAPPHHRAGQPLLLTRR
ncbi:MAG: hypothetical protein AB2A00_11130 [Myxococcota bacterium]